MNEMKRASGYVPVRINAFQRLESKGMVQYVAFVSG